MADCLSEDLVVKKNGKMIGAKAVENLRVSDLAKYDITIRGLVLIIAPSKESPGKIGY